MCILFGPQGRAPPLRHKDAGGRAAAPAVRRQAVPAVVREPSERGRRCCQPWLQELRGFVSSGSLRSGASRAAAARGRQASEMTKGHN